MSTQKNHLVKKEFIIIIIGWLKRRWQYEIADQEFFRTFKTFKCKSNIHQMNRSVFFVSFSVLTETFEIFKKGKINLIVGFIPNFDPSYSGTRK